MCIRDQGSQLLKRLSSLLHLRTPGRGKKGMAHSHPSSVDRYCQVVVLRRLARAQCTIGNYVSVEIIGPMANQKVVQNRTILLMARARESHVRPSVCKVHWQRQAWLRPLVQWRLHWANACIQIGLMRRRTMEGERSVEPCRVVNGTKCAWEMQARR